MGIHIYKLVKPTEWTHTFECKVCGRTKQFLPERKMTCKELAILDKAPCIDTYETKHNAAAVGVSGTTRIIVRPVAGKFEARMGVAILGSVDMTEQQMKDCDRNPFSEKFHGNFAQGFGDSSEEAIAELRDDVQRLAVWLWS